MGPTASTIRMMQAKNIRDLGGIPVAGGRASAPGLMFRGGALYGLTDEELATLVGDLGVRRIIDLRIGYERAKKPEPTVPGVESLWIPFYDNDVVGREYFKPVPGTITIGKDFACDPIDFYRDMANELTARQIGQALHATLDAASAGTPVYFHCSNGKDRAGILALLVLELLGADPDAIEANYLATNVWRDTQVERIYQRFLRLCEGDEERARRITAGHAARPENLVAFRTAVDERYGGMDAYLRDALGFSDAARADLRERLTVPA